MTQATLKSKPSRRTDLLALLGGVLFSLLVTGAIWLTGQRLASVPHLPDAGASWYYWKLPTATFWGRFTAWGFYALHQIAFWAAIYYAQTRVKRYQAALQRINVIALAINAFFILLHIIQSQVWYDGLAQDVSIWSAQGSVVLMLVFILLMENPRRGLFFGKKMPLPQRAVQLVRKYHGYIFAWATVYTLWYHPTEPTSGHLIGFLYMFLLLLQGSLFLTRVHVNRWWMVLQEVMVLVHGSLVAVMQRNNIWPMFAFGFGGIFVITQMHGLGLSRLVRGLILAAYVAAALGVYSQRGWIQLNEIVRIPIIEYLAVFAIAYLIGGALWLFSRLPARALADEVSQPGDAGATD